VGINIVPQIEHGNERRQDKGIKGNNPGNIGVCCQELRWNPYQATEV